MRGGGVARGSMNMRPRPAGFGARLASQRRNPAQRRAPAAVGADRGGPGGDGGIGGTTAAAATVSATPGRRRHQQQRQPQHQHQQQYQCRRRWRVGTTHPPPGRRRHRHRRQAAAYGSYYYALPGEAATVRLWVQLLQLRRRLSRAALQATRWSRESPIRRSSSAARRRGAPTGAPAQTHAVGACVTPPPAPKALTGGGARPAPGPLRRSPDAEAEAMACGLAARRPLAIVAGSAATHAARRGAPRAEAQPSECKGGWHTSVPTDGGTKRWDAQTLREPRQTGDQAFP